MYLRNDVTIVKQDIEKFLGSRVRLESNKGKNKSTVNVGVISSVYPSIFTVQLYDGKEPSRKLSFSYTDVLTNSVEITLCD
ncbi:MAG: Veg family protein [Clostridiales bacterium]|jgi:uncharacterized protein Veg|nr:Veg family protein [Clostridiales bacterium]